MFDTTLSQLVERFTASVQSAGRSELEKTWAWGEYDSEGTRFGFFRIYEELRELAVRLAALRMQVGPSLNTAQHILAQYHLAYRDLQAALIGLDEVGAGRSPAEDEWPVREAYKHIVSTEVGFYMAIRYALDRHRSGDDRPATIPDEAWETTTGISDEMFSCVLNGSLAELRRFHDQWHVRVVEEFSGITEEELSKPSMYWESYPMPVRFRLHRFDSHMRQHTIQIDETLQAVGLSPGETRRLLRLIYNALGEAEGQGIGAGEVKRELFEKTALAIGELTGEIEKLF